MSKDEAFINAWVEKGERQVPITTLLPGRTIPIWTRRTIQEPVEPMHAAWSRLVDILNALSDDVDEHFYQPSPEHRDLINLEREMRAQAFRDVPNPEYDPERAKDHWTHQTKIETGQSYHSEKKA